MLGYQTERKPYLKEILACVASLQNEHHGLLALQKTDSNIYAHQKQLVASGNFRDSVQNITDENWIAILAFSVSILVCHFDRSGRSYVELEQDPVMESIFLLRNSANLGRQLHPWLLHSGLISRVQQGLASNVPARDELAETAIADLRNINKRSSIDDTMTDGICSDSIDKLESWLHLTAGQPRTWLHFIWWPGELSDEYIQLLSDKNPKAVIIFLHWCAIMAKAPKRWFVEGWAQRIAECALHDLDQHWSGEVSWARRQLQL
ncbi:unnamed protein product [Clonostachys rosea]|uniref:Uncharacterized protein n=1 Tax=Bionectria ochroleuca TaxID=29856 RepID=A0ABY6ULL2_BIOOC|nr:unnamed protein product [Clonostachys rosea]